MNPEAETLRNDTFISASPTRSRARHKAGSRFSARTI